jgi:hypothetical protein
MNDFILKSFNLNEIIDSIIQVINNNKNFYDNFIPFTENEMKYINFDKLKPCYTKKIEKKSLYHMSKDKYEKYSKSCSHAARSMKKTEAEENADNENENLDNEEKDIINIIEAIEDDEDSSSNFINHINDINDQISFKLDSLKNFSNDNSLSFSKESKDLFWSSDFFGSSFFEDNKNNLNNNMNNNMNMNIIPDSYKDSYKDSYPCPSAYLGTDLGLNYVEPKDKEYEFNEEEASFCSEIMEVFLTEVPKYLETLKDNIKNENLEDIKFNAHKIKSSMLIFGQKKVFDIFEKIEINYKTYSIEKIKLMYVNIFKILRKYVKSKY